MSIKTKKAEIYKRKEDGSIDWRAMIKPEYLYPNKEWFNKRSLPTPTSTEGLKDNQLLIMLGGIKEIAKMRGYRSVTYKLDHVKDGYVVAICSIIWNKNPENDFEVVYEDVGNATLDNTDDFCSKFLETIACNRAFVRAVRNFLNIHIVGADEIDRSSGQSQNNFEDYGDEELSPLPLTPVGLLQSVLLQHGYKGFDGLKDCLRKLWKIKQYQNEAVPNWKSFEDVPPAEARKIIPLVKKHFSD